MAAVCAEIAEECDIDSAITYVSEDLDSISSLKTEQREALKTFLGRRDVLGVLPTGFGKSLIYQISPLVCKKLGSANPIVIVVTPLVALMQDQIREASKLGVTAVQLGTDDKGVLEGKYQLVFGGPERWVLQEMWRNMLSSATYRENLIGIVVDEVHICYKWGQGSKGQPAFREAFSRLGELRSLVKEGTPILALTASADLQSTQKVVKILNMEEAHTIRVSPNKLNIRLGLVQIPHDKLLCLDWIVKDIRSKGTDMGSIIIYCRSLKAVGKVFCHLQSELGDDAWVGDDKCAKNMLIGMYHASTLPKYKERVVNSLLGQGSCRVVVATTALVMGVNFKNVTHVVLYGSPEDMEDVLQMIGRGGRDGQQAHGVLYYYRQQLIKVDKAVKEFIEGESDTCIRKRLYSNFEEEPTSHSSGHKCCTMCHRQCQCEEPVCPVSFPQYEAFVNTVKIPVRTRKVAESQYSLVREMLEEYRKSLSNHKGLVTTDVESTGFGKELIDAVVKDCCLIFTVDYVVNNLPVYRLAHAKEILIIIHEVLATLTTLIHCMLKQLIWHAQPYQA